jgi:hypothetical protein
MQNRKILVFIFLISFTLFISCAQSQHAGTSKPQAKWDTLYASYPRYRIDSPIRKISIIGIGEGKIVISARLTSNFIEWTSPAIKVIEPGNLEAVLGGRIIEYGAGLTRDESQAISQMLQVDHLLLFDVKTSPHQNYIYGGRFEVRINLKIINTVSGEIVFQTSKSWGAHFPDPKPTYSHWAPVPSIDRARAACFVMVQFELRYALGEVVAGLIGFKRSPNYLEVSSLLINSPADKEGIRKGDKIIEINGTKIRNRYEYEEYFKNLPRLPKQGNHLKMKLERDGRILEVVVKFPVIQKPPVEKELKKIDKKQKPVGPKI